jgi:hypothetical protein
MGMSVWSQEQSKYCLFDLWINFPSDFRLSIKASLSQETTNQPDRYVVGITIQPVPLITSTKAKGRSGIYHRHRQKETVGDRTGSIRRCTTSPVFICKPATKGQEKRLR